MVSRSKENAKEIGSEMKSTQARTEDGIKLCEDLGPPDETTLRAYLFYELRHDDFNNIAHIKVGAGIFSAILSGLFVRLGDRTSTPEHVSPPNRVTRPLVLVMPPLGEYKFFLDHNADLWSMEPCRVQ